MSKTILVLKTSVKGDWSVSNKLIDRVLAKLNASNDASNVVVTHDLGAGALGPIDGTFCQAMWAGEKTPEQVATLEKAMAFIEDLKRADVVVIGCPICKYFFTTARAHTQTQNTHRRHPPKKNADAHFNPNNPLTHIISVVSSLVRLCVYQPPCLQQTTSATRRLSSRSSTW